MRVAVTGSTGFLGSHVVAGLAGAGHEVVGVLRDVRRSARVRELGASTVRAADLGDAPALEAAFAGTEAVALVAALAIRDRDPPWAEWVEANVAGVERSIVAAARAGARRVVLVSTVAVHRLLRPSGTVAADARRLDEARVPVSLHWLTTNRRYSLSKAMGEALALRRAAELGLELTILRPGPIYGSRDPKLTSRYLELLDRRVVALPTARVPHVHAGDVAAAVRAALERPGAPSRAYFVTGDPCSPVEIVRTLRELAGRGPRIVPVPLPLRLAYADGPLRRELGVGPRPLRVGLEEVLRGRGSG